MRVEYRPIWRKFYVCDNIEQAYDLNNYEPVHNSKYNGLGSNFFEFFLNSSKVNELEVELDCDGSHLCTHLPDFSFPWQRRRLAHTLLPQRVDDR